jgi:NAD-dependent SIR2 family protein deacetylase
MRFLENGADIPNDLIRAVNDGTVTFLCGAGVSLGAGLPLFEGLTESVYQRLGESWKGEAAERRAIENKEFDRALRSLEKRTHLPRATSHVRNAVSELLTSSAGPFPDHRAILQLSQDSEGRPRVLTTNFDTFLNTRQLKAASRVSGATPANRCPSQAACKISEFSTFMGELRTVL